MTDSRDDSRQTHFGFEHVPVGEKARRVKGVFDSVAPRYDLMNDLMSFGIHRLWKRITVELAALRPGQRALDLAAGTGDLTARLTGQVGDQGRVIAGDINGTMLRRGRDRLLDHGVTGNVDYVQCDAQHLPFADNSFDCLTMAFGLRNVNWLYEHYSFKLLPLIGKLVAGDDKSYRYLAESIRMHPDQETLKSMMEEAGLTGCEYFNVTTGIVALHRGYKF